MPVGKDAWAAAGATVVVVAAVALGFWVLGGPSRQRQIHGDNERITALVKLARQVNSSWSRANHTLPASLAAVVADVPRDPITGAPYLYHPLGQDRYELCATFALDNRKEVAEGRYETWAHPKGYYCFQMNASRPVSGYYNYP